jgi:leucyl-tRNA synthetase
VDLYIGGSEHATGHLLYSRFWQKFMFDKGLVPKDEFAKKLINQGMITGTSAFMLRQNCEVTLALFENENTEIKKYQIFVITDEKLASDTSEEQLKEKVINHVIDIVNREEGIEKYIIDSFSFDLHVSIRVPVEFVNSSDELDVNSFINSPYGKDYKNALFVSNKTYREIEKMSKSKYNVVNPDDIVKEYGADSLRLYEMFLGPLEQSKPWNTAGITGTNSFLKKLWRQFHTGENGTFKVSEEEPSKESWKTLHKTIKKVEEDIENFSFNTSVATFMICVNELSSQKCISRNVLEPLVILVSPYAPHIAEELWEKLGHKESIATAPFPKFEEKYVVERSKEYPISFNGKMRFKLELPLEMDKEAITEAVMAHEKTQQQLQGRTPKKVIVVPGKIVNIVG